MKPNKELLDDLLADDVSLEFRGTLMAKTLQSAQHRRRVRRLNLMLSVIALVGIFAFAFQEMRVPKTASNPIRQQISSVASSPLNDVNIVSTKPNSFKTAVVSDSSHSTFTVVQTTAADRPKEINDRELLALVGDKPVALIHQSAHKAELIFLNPKDEKGFSVQ
jgi:hypothetical protein